MSTGLLDDPRKVQPEAAPDDIDACIATFSDEERRNLAAAEAAIDVAILLHRARERKGLSQGAAARLAGLQQQAVSRFERPAANHRLDTIQAYLGALGYALELNAVDLDTGETAATAVLPPRRPRGSLRPPGAPRKRQSRARGRSTRQPAAV